MRCFIHSKGSSFFLLNKRGINQNAIDIIVLPYIAKTFIYYSGIKVKTEKSIKDP